VRPPAPWRFHGTESPATSALVTWLSDRGHRRRVLGSLADSLFVGGSKQLRVVTKSPAAKAVLEFAVDNDWVVVEEDHDVRID